jgi:isocitrate dehydrogenase
MSDIKPITVAYGDGIGPEIMEATLFILKEAQAKIRIETIEVGEKLYKKNYSSGIAEDTWESLSRTGILLKAPITTPQGGGYKSLNVTLRKSLGLFANIRPGVAYAPFVETAHPTLDIVVVRENEEDLYAGIEYRQTHNMYQSLKLITRVGCEKIIRHAFEYAVKNNRKKVTCFSKDNIMKFSDGIFHQVFNEIAKEYPNIINDHYIIDIGTARLATQPEKFDVIVTSNLYGDIISDVIAEVSGSVGMAGSANLGENYAMFEAIHGSAPDIAGKNIANPSGLINAAIMMLIHLEQGSIAEKIENAWKKTIEDGIHTPDIYNEKISVRKVGTKEFAEEIVKRLGQKPSKLKAVSYPEQAIKEEKKYSFAINKSEKKELVGIDVFIDMNESNAAIVAEKIKPLEFDNIKLKTISAKGLKLWPSNQEFHIMSDHWCLRFMNEDEKTVMQHTEIVALLAKLVEENIDYIKTENLYNFNGVRGYSLAQGE